jgi:hypothetical protein
VFACCAPALACPADNHQPGAWPLDDGIRYVVLTVAQGRITE